MMPSTVLKSLPLLVGGLLAGCGTVPPATRFLLPPAPATIDDTRPDGAVRVADFRLPAYLAGSAIAGLSPDGTVSGSAAEQWAEEPVTAVTRAFGEALRVATGRTVIYEPWPAGLDSPPSVSVTLHRLIGARSGQARIWAQVQVLSAERVLEIRDVVRSVPVRGNDTPALVRAYSEALAALAAAVAPLVEKP